MAVTAQHLPYRFPRRGNQRGATTAILTWQLRQLTKDILTRHVFAHISTCFDMFPVAIADPKFEEKTFPSLSSFLSETVQWLTACSSLAIACIYLILEKIEIE